LIFSAFFSLAIKKTKVRFIPLIMAFTWNYTDMEISTLPDPSTSHSTKHGISRVLSMGLGGFGSAKMSDRKHLVRNFKRVKTLLKFSGIYVEDMKSGSFGFYLAMIRVFLIVALCKSVKELKDQATQL
jgi:hypothetical protein